MRINSDSIRHIVATIKKFIPDAQVYLHGSRVDDRKRGGDIDLLLLCPNLVSKYNARQFREKILVALKESLDDQRIDLTIVEPNDFTREPVYLSMLKTAVLLGPPNQP